LAPWKVYEYPGGERLIAALCGVSVGLARDWCSGAKRLPLRHAQRLRDDLAGRAAALQALHDEFADYVRRLERERAIHPHPGYSNGLARWRREQAAKKAEAEKW
jgi:hypothetical protein